MFLLLAASLSFAQQPAPQNGTSASPSKSTQQSQQQQKPAQQPAQQPAQPPAKAQPAPLFGGKLGIKSSERTKESATLGFNGIDPSGKVDAKMLATSPGADDAEKVKALDSVRPAPEQLAAFLTEGALKKK